MIPFVNHADGFHLYGDSPFPFELHGIKHLVLHLSFFNRASQLQKTVRKRGLAVVYMRYDAKVADVFQTHRLILTEIRSTV